MNKITTILAFFIFVVSCSENSDSVKITKCLDESSMVNVRSTVDTDVEVDDADYTDENEDSLDVAKLVSLENDMMIIDLTSDFNCSDSITYSVESFIDDSILLIDITSKHDGPVTLCICRKTITIEVNESAENLEKISKVRFKLPDAAEYRDAQFEK